MEKTVIGHRTEEYDALVKKENQAKEATKELEDIAQNVLNGNKVRNWQEYLNEPFGYLAKEYFELYGKNEPPNTSATLFLGARVDLEPSTLKTPLNAFRDAIKSMGKHAPVVNKTGVKFNLNREDFNIYLNLEKKEEYEATKKFLETAKTLKELGQGYSSIHLVRYAEGVIRTNTGVDINPYKFG